MNEIIILLKQIQKKQEKALDSEQSDSEESIDLLYEVSELLEDAIDKCKKYNKIFKKAERKSAKITELEFENKRLKKQNNDLKKIMGY